MLKSILIGLSVCVYLVICDDTLCKGKYDGQMVADPKNPNQFHVCNWNKDIATKSCMFINEKFDEQLQTCVETEHFDKMCPGQNGKFEYPGNPHKFIVCFKGYPYVFTCPPTTVWVQSGQQCGDNVDGKTWSPI